MRIQLGDREVGAGCPTYVICEGGINASGSVDRAKRMIDAAAEAGADCFKLQVRDVETTYTRAPYADGYLDTPREHPLGGKQTTRRQKHALEFPQHVHEQLRMHALDQGLAYTVSAWDEKALTSAVALGVAFLKVASPCIMDGPLMRAHGATGLPLVVSTGGCNLADIEVAIANLRQGHGERGFSLDLRLVLLHCCSTYPSKDDELNLRAIVTMREHFGVPVGWSGHDLGIATASATVPLGACIVERHLTLDRSAYGSDNPASLEPGAFARMVRDIRAVESALGDGVKRAMPSEEAALRKMRRVVD